MLLPGKNSNSQFSYFYVSRHCLTCFAATSIQSHVYAAGKNVSVAATPLLTFADLTFVLLRHSSPI